MKKVLVSTASKGREDYNKAQLNLIKSATNTNNVTRNWYDDYLIRSVDGYCDNYMGVKIELGQWPSTLKYGVSWQHADMPYQFKPFAIYEAYELGYTKILWCDSTIRILRNPDELWGKCAELGVLAWDNLGHPLSPYISDYAVSKLGNPDVSEIKQIMACCMMFDFDNPKTLPLVEDWIEGSLNNSFHPSTEGSRRDGYKCNKHDQAYLSALMYKYDIEIQPYGDLAYPHHTPVKPFFLNWGVAD